MNTITWKNAAGLVTVAPVIDGEAKLNTVHGPYYAPVRVVVTGRILTRTPAGTLGTRCSIDFGDAVVNVWTA